MKLYNSLTRKKEVFVPIQEKKVGMYTCGPTVYSFVSIGNWRTYTLGDLLFRAFRYFGNDVTYIMNITDVGHLTGDNLGDADTGEDRLEKAAKREGKNAWDLARFYTEDFYLGYEALNLTKPNSWCKATDFIPEQIEMVQKIIDRGFGYQIADGIYFDTQAFEAQGHIYGQLSNLKEIKAGARVEPNPEKKDQRDFALWKFSPVGEKRQMEWESPWGVGFPGWHIECSAMSVKYLGDQFDVHVGGEDLRSTHHPNEIAQSEAATGKSPFVAYWIHGSFLTVDGGRMGKSLGNAYTLSDIVAKGFDPLDLRYFYLSSHYRKQLNFTWDALLAAQHAYRGLKNLMVRFKTETNRTAVSPEKLTKIDSFKERFEAVIEDDLNMPEALAVAWEVAKSNLPGMDKYDLLIEFDKVFGLKLDHFTNTAESIPESVAVLVKMRETARLAKDFTASDKLRKEISDLGYEVQDVEEGWVVKKDGRIVEKETSK